jgi:hypothetical protein
VAYSKNAGRDPLPDSEEVQRSRPCGAGYNSYSISTYPDPNQTALTFIAIGALNHRRRLFVGFFSRNIRFSSHSQNFIIIKSCRSTA